jgi:hypothetical protein
MQFPSAMTHVEIEAIVDGVRRRHGRAGLLALAEICQRELALPSPARPETQDWSVRPSLVGS